MSYTDKIIKALAVYEMSRGYKANSVAVSYKIYADLRKEWKAAPGFWRINIFGVEVVPTAYADYEQILPFCR